VIVVDSSVWIANLRNLDTAAVQSLRAVIDDGKEQVLVGDLILLEVLQGARDEGHAARIEGNLRRFQVVPMLDDKLAVQAARNYRMLRGIGITIRKTIDVVIGTFCIADGHSLLHDDRDFDPMVRHLGLQVA
jgi:predicted nucleic acid-binding protein